VPLIVAPYAAMIMLVKHGMCLDRERDGMDTLFSVEEAARRLGRTSKWTVHAWLSQGRIQWRAHRTRKHICRFFVDSLDSPLLVWQSAMHVTHIKALKKRSLGRAPRSALIASKNRFQTTQNRARTATFRYVQDRHSYS